MKELLRVGQEILSALDEPFERHAELLPLLEERERLLQEGISHCSPEMTAILLEQNRRLVERVKRVHEDVGRVVQQNRRWGSSTPLAPSRFVDRRL